jgi:hypothetical protein
MYYGTKQIYSADAAVTENRFTTKSISQYNRYTRGNTATTKIKTSTAYCSKICAKLSIMHTYDLCSQKQIEIHVLNKFILHQIQKHT